MSRVKNAKQLIEAFEEGGPMTRNHARGLPLVAHRTAHTAVLSEVQGLASAVCLCAPTASRNGSVRTQ